MWIMIIHICINARCDNFLCRITWIIDKTTWQGLIVLVSPFAFKTLRMPWFIYIENKAKILILNIENVVEMQQYYSEHQKNGLEASIFNNVWYVL